MLSFYIQPARNFKSLLFLFKSSTFTDLLPLLCLTSWTESRALLTYSCVWQTSPILFIKLQAWKPRPASSICAQGHLSSLSTHSSTQKAKMPFVWSWHVPVIHETHGNCRLFSSRLTVSALGSSLIRSTANDISCYITSAQLIPQRTRAYQSRLLPSCVA